ncbi:hypothetical protein [Cupriavidus sp. IDO]|uniref:hypothetical protein n=1 Tax=Cupriavidus sp. IDO TaxID=1539142 RepID=UPI0005799E1D|nr:hypothetical protein [Cupriavidus sp. IDO]KWR88898.1 hypothetical protein RM96_17090 [Cupriavidus sp. IDO]
MIHNRPLMAGKAAGPLLVYLDSSDFSVLSDSRQRTDKHDEIERRLFEWQSTGEIQLRFSFAHVIEAAPVESSDLEAAKNRLLHIQQLCGSASFADPASVFESEIRGAGLSADRWGCQSIYRDDGYWMPPLDGLEIGIPSLLSSVQDELSSKPLNRAERRMAKKALFDGKGRLRNASRKPLSGISDPNLRRELDQFPLTPEGLDQVGRFVCGLGSKEQALQAIANSMIDLGCFADWYARKWDQASPLSQSLRQSGEALRAALHHSSSAVRKACETLQSVGESQKAKSAIKEALNSVLENLPKALMCDLAESFGIRLGESAQCSWERTPSLATVARIVCHVGRLSALMANGGRKPRASDLGDTLHAIYLPHVDIFRADGFMANAISDARLPWNTTVVSKLIDLPAAIERRLEAKM